MCLEAMISPSVATDGFCDASSRCKAEEFAVAANEASPHTDEDCSSDTSEVAKAEVATVVTAGA